MFLSRQGLAMSAMSRFLSATAFAILVSGLVIGFLSGVLVDFLVMKPEIKTETVTTTATATTITTATTTVAVTAPSIIFHNGKVLTMEPSIPVAEALAVKGERIMAVGSGKDVLALRAPETKVVDLEGKTLLPGFIDGHTHVLRFPQRRGNTIDEAMAVALS